jgi:Ca2+-binding EF-hand superfamily protein
MGSDAADDAFAKLDTDKNGVLSKAELARHPMAAHAAMVDANRDGSLDRKEFEALQRM